MLVHHRHAMRSLCSGDVVCMQGESSHTGKTALIRDYLKQFKGDVQLLFKLLLPHKNIDTRTYQVGVIRIDTG